MAAYGPGGDSSGTRRCGYGMGAAVRFPVRLLGCFLAAVFVLGQPPAAAQAATSARAPAPRRTTSTLVRGYPTVVQFVRPRPGYPDRTVVNEAVRLIKTVPRGGQIRLTMFTLTRHNVSKALIAASRRGVSVKVTLAAHSRDYSAAQALKRALGRNLVFCGTRSGGGCITGSRLGLAHSKFMTLSSARTPSGARRAFVVWVSSANFSQPSETRHENAVTTYGDKRAFVALNRVFGLAFRQVHFAGNDFNTGKPPAFWIGSSGLRGFHSPAQQFDLWYKRLKPLTGGRGCTIRLQNSTWRIHRIAVARLLVEKSRAGCRVRVGVSRIDRQVLLTLRAGGIPVRRTRGAHDKFVVAHARYFGSARYRNLVWTGSHNLTYGGNNRQDEIIVRISSRAVAVAFAHEFDLLQSRATRI